MGREITTIIANARPCGITIIAMESPEIKSPNKADFYNLLVCNELGKV